MNTESLKVPLNGNFFEDTNRKKFPKGLMVIAFCCIIFISAISFVFSIYSYIRLQKLENEINLYQTKTLAALRNILDDDLYKLIAKFENEENFEEEGDETPQTERNYYDDYDYDSSNDLNNNDVKIVTDNEILATGDFSKDGAKYRRKRNVVAATVDGVLINSESYADVKRKNGSLRRINHDLRVTPVSARPSVYGSTWSDFYSSTQSPPVYSRASRVMHNEDKSKAFKQVVRKSMLKAGDMSNEEYSNEGHIIVRDDYHRKRYRNRAGHLESLDETRTPHRMGRIKPLPSIRLDGDTSKYVVGQHSNFNGNGHMKHPRKTYIDWKAKSWVNSAGMNEHFEMNDEGELTVKDSGLYFIYAQIYYLDEHDTNGFRVYKNSDDTLLQCTTSTHTQERKFKGNTCYTAGADYLAENDVISLADLSDGRYSLFEPGKSFFGVIKLGDMKVK